MSAHQLDLFTPPVLYVVPICPRCNEPVSVIEADDPTGQNRWDIGVKWAIIALATHDREHHPEVVQC